MRSAPTTGCFWSRISSKRSAGGQLEQPSDVKSSKSTGTRAARSSSAAQVMAPADKHNAAVNKLRLFMMSFHHQFVEGVSKVTPPAGAVAYEHEDLLRIHRGGRPVKYR